MKKLFFILIPCIFLWLAVGGCKKGCKGEQGDFVLFDFRLVDKNTNQAVINANGQPYHKDSIRLKHVTSIYTPNRYVELEYILVPDPTSISGYHFRNVEIYGFSPPDLQEIYHLYLNKSDTDTIIVKSNGSVDGCHPSVKFYYNGVFVSQHDYDGNNNNNPNIIFKK